MIDIKIAAKNLHARLQDMFYFDPSAYSVGVGSGDLFVYWHVRVNEKYYIVEQDDYVVNNKYIGKIRLC